MKDEVQGRIATAATIAIYGLTVLAALIFVAFINGVIEDYAQYTPRHVHGCTVEQQGPSEECP